MNNNRVVEWIVKIGLLVVPVLPLVVTRSLYFPFITGRNFAFRIIIEIIFVFWLWLMMSDAKYRPRSSYTLYSFIALIVVLFLATIFGISPYKSFWSSFERMEGFWGFWHYFLYFLMLISVFRRQADWSRFFFVSLAVSILISFYGLFQLLGKLSVHQGSVRLDATMGNATYLAIYLIFHIFLFLYFLFRTKNIWLRCVYLLAIIFELFIVYRTATRGAILGLLAGLITFSVVNLIWGDNKKLKYIALGCFSTVILVSVIFIVARNSRFVQSSEVLSRFASISFTETTTQSRFIIWNMAFKAWKDRPVLGWGPESFVYIFSKYYDSRMWQQEPWFDRAHNVFFDWLTSAGLVGLMAYLGLFGSGIFMLWRLIRNNPEEAKIVGVFMGVLTAYFVHNIFVFDNFTSYIIFFAVLAYLHFYYYQVSSKTDEAVLADSVAAVPKFVRVGVIVVTAGTVIFSVYSFNVKPILASQDIIESLRSLSYTVQGGTKTHDLDRGRLMLEQGINRNTFGTAEIREQLAQSADKISNDPGTSPKDKQKIIKFALDQMKIQEDRFPYDMRAKAFLSTLYGDAGDAGNAIIAAQDGLVVSDKRQQFYFLLGEAYFRAGEEDLAIATLKQAYDLAPDYPDAINNYAIVLIFAGHPQEAEALLKKHFGAEVVANPKYINAYVALGKFDKVALIWEKIVAQDPNNAQNRLSLASAYVKTFQDKKAIEQLEKTIELAPAFKQQGEIFIKQIKEGKLKR